MTAPTHEEAEQRVRAAIEALRRGDAATARQALEAAIASGALREQPWLMLAQACRIGGDTSGEIAALDRLLADKPRDLAGLLMMGSAKARSDDDRAAQSFFRLGLRVAELTSELPRGIEPLLDEAQRFVGQASARFQSHLQTQLNGLSAALPGRVGHALDLLLGKRTIYPQQPNSFYFPELAQRQFFDRRDFEWVAVMEAAVPQMRDEYHRMAGLESAFNPYVAANPDRPRPANHLLDDPSWGACYFWRSGEPVAINAERCPATMAALEHAPMPRITGRSPMALWSRLSPGTHIKPHHGLLNTRLICHLPLIVPEGCALRVGNETREWREGEMLIFDDSIEHEAWNQATSDRIVLLFEIWRPDIDDDERAALTTLFEAIDSYTGVPVDTG